MLTLTFASLRKAGACPERYRVLAKFKGSVRKWGKDKPFPLVEVLESNGLDDALWAFRCCEPIDERDRLSKLFACDCAERVLYLYEKEYPKDGRPRQAIEIARKFAVGEATQVELAAAWDTRVAARAATENAAWDAWAAWAAVWAAEAAGDAWAAVWAAEAAGDAWAAEAVWAAAWDARDATENAAWDARAAEAAGWAAETAEREWQSKHLKEMLTPATYP